MSDEQKKEVNEKQAQLMKQLEEVNSEDKVFLGSQKEVRRVCDETCF